MEQRPFGQPSEDVYYVTSSEFTSKDVENFKRLGRNSNSPVSRSECSSSSRISCPDPPKMNVSPAAYVQNRVPKRSMTSQSESSLDCLSGSLDQVDHAYTMYDENFIDPKDGADSQITTDAYIHNSETVEENEKMDIDNDVAGILDLPPVSQPPEELLKEIYSELIPDNVQQKDPQTVIKKELEESWEEFYKTPEKKGCSDDSESRKTNFQRLESFTQDMREKAIVSDFKSEDQTNERINEKDEDDRVGYDFGSIYETEGLGTDTTTQPEKSKGQPYEQDKLDKTENYPSERLKNSQVENVLKEQNADSSSPLTESNLKLLEEELSNYVEEKVKIDENDDEIEEVTMKHSSPVKKKKRDRSSALLNKLKPPLSSPPRQGALTPELSDAVAEEINTIPISGDRDYLKKHRLSLPVVSGVHASPRQEHRQSLPNLGEGVEDDLLKEIYDGMPLDNNDDKNDSQNKVDDILDEEEDRIGQKYVIAFFTPIVHVYNF